MLRYLIHILYATYAIFYASACKAGAGDPHNWGGVAVGALQTPGIGSMPEQALSEKLSRKRFARKIRGPKDPHYPARIVIQSQIFARKTAKPLPAPLVDRDGNFNLTLLTPEILLALPLDTLKNLLGDLAQSTVKVRWYDRRGHVRTGKKGSIPIKKWVDSNPAAVLAFLAAVSHHDELFIRMLIAAPISCLQLLSDDAAGVITEEIISSALAGIMHDMASAPVAEAATGGAHIVHIYIRYWAGRDYLRFEPLFMSLVRNTYPKLTSVEGFQRHRQVGVLLGCMIGGVFHHNQEIRARDEKRLWLVNSISNLIWASSTYLGIAPLMAAPASLLIGTVSVTAVAAAVVFNRLGLPRDYSHIFKGLEGRIELLALSSAENKSQEYMVGVLTTLAWMQASVHANTYFD